MWHTECWQPLQQKYGNEKGEGRIIGNCGGMTAAYKCHVIPKPSDTKG